jgi:AraC-like DNA-binding protein
VTTCADADPSSPASPPFVVRVAAAGVARGGIASAHGVQMPLDGPARWRIDGTVADVVPGAFVWLRPGDRYDAYAAEPRRIAEAWLADDVLATRLAPLLTDDDFAEPRASCDAARLAPPLHPGRHDDATVAALLAAAADDASPAADALLAPLCAALLALHRVESALARRAPGVRPATRRDIYGRVERARQLVCDALGAVRPGGAPAPRLDVATLAGAAFMSPFHFVRAFHAVYGVTPQAFVAACRLERARVLLATEPAMPVRAVGVAVGFANPSAFARAFHRRFGAPPRAMRGAVAPVVEMALAPRPRCAWIGAGA